MKINRFIGTDMRETMRLVRNSLGAEAVILETNRVDDGVEISAAVDFDPVEYQRSRKKKLEATTASDNPERADENPVHHPAPSVDTPRTSQDIPVVARTVESDPEFQKMRHEVNTIRCLLEEQMSRLIWDDKSRRSAGATSVMRNLSSLGLTPDIVQRLLGEIENIEGLDNSWSVPLKHLVQGIPVCSEDMICEGGIFALVGSTGVGKTTTIAKLAARYALRNDAADIALITTDNFRVGAREQLEIFGQILGAPVYHAEDRDALSEVIRGIDSKKLILIDTAGMSPRDTQLVQQLSCLGDTEQDIRVLLTIPANAQAESMQEMLDAFQPASPDACVLTKIDEATSLGGAVSAVMRSGLPLAYIANGQRVPEDLHFAGPRRAWLVKASVELMRLQNNLAAEDYMAEEFAEAVIDECA
jgi:flagellar biosynthesis protein FlhF